MSFVLASGYFDPLHIGHVEYLNEAAKLGDHLIVIVNNDEQARLKKGKAFMPEQERMAIVSNLKCVFSTFLSIDTDKSVCKSIELIAKQYQVTIFAKGGDRLAGEIPEGQICQDLGIVIVDGLGQKIQSSSELIARAKQ